MCFGGEVYWMVESMAFHARASLPTVTIVNTIGFLVNVIGYNAVQGGHIFVGGTYLIMLLPYAPHATMPHIVSFDIHIHINHMTHTVGWMTMVNTYWYVHIPNYTCRNECERLMTPSPPNLTGTSSR